VVIDLKQPVEIHSISVVALQKTPAQIYSPMKIEYFISTDGLKFEKIAEIENAPDSPSGETLLKNYEATFVPVIASFVKIIATNTGKDKWIFIDEIKAE